MGEVFNDLISKIEGWFKGFVLMLPNLVIAILVFLGFFFLAKYLKKTIVKIISNFSDNRAMIRLVANLLTVTIVILGLFIALGILDLNKTVTSLLAGAGVVGLAIGLAFQDPILIGISGVLLSVQQVSFKLGDLVKTNEYYGHVKQITLRTTIIKTLTGEDVIVPNKMVVQNPIVNYNYSADRRVDIACGVAYNSNLEEVEKIATEAIEKNIEKNQGTKVEFMYTRFGASSIDFTLRYWIEETGEKNFLVSRGNAIKAIKKAFDANGINIPFPIRTLEFSQQKVVDGISGGPKAS